MEEYVGNKELLLRRKVGFVASRTVSPLSVLPVLDWASGVSHEAGTAVVCGFQSLQERDVLRFLERGVCGVICVLGRKSYKRLPEHFQALAAAGRLLVISISQSPRTTEESALERNRYICRLCNEVVFPSVPQEGSRMHGLFNEVSEERRRVLVK